VALATWRSGYPSRLRNRRPGFESSQGKNTVVYASFLMFKKKNKGIIFLQKKTIKYFLVQLPAG
jgi:hypothetical protein